MKAKNKCSLAEQFVVKTGDSKGERLEEAKRMVHNEFEYILASPAKHDNLPALIVLKNEILDGGAVYPSPKIKIISACFLIVFCLPVAEIPYAFIAVFVFDFEVPVFLELPEVVGVLGGGEVDLHLAGALAQQEVLLVDDGQQVDPGGRVVLHLLVVLAAVEQVELSAHEVRAQFGQVAPPVGLDVIPVYREGVIRGFVARSFFCTQ
jgi:hypothetical protein